MLYLSQFWPLLLLFIPLQLSGQCTPSPVVYNGLAVSLPPSGSISLPASVFDAGSIDECGTGGLIFSYSTDTGDTHKTFDCNIVGNTVEVDIWVTDLNGGQTYARTFVLIQDKLAACPPLSLDCGPIPIAYNGLSVDISAGPVTIPAEAFEAGSIDQCATGQLSVEVGFPGSGEFDGEITFDCNSVPISLIELRVTDALGNQNSVETYITVSDGQDYCGGNSPISTCGPAPVLMNGLVVALPGNGQVYLPESALFIDAIDGCSTGNLSTTIAKEGVSPNYQLNTLFINCYDVGTMLVSGYVRDLNGNEASAESYILVQDNIAPQIPEGGCDLGNLNINLSYYPGEITANIYSFEVITVNDNCDDLKFSFSPDVNDRTISFNCSNVGIYQVPVWVTDKGNNTANCEVAINVKDNYGYCNNDCTGDQYYFEENPPQLVYRASDYIEASCVIPDTHGAHKIFQASNSVRLLPGFHTTDNAQFIASVVPCTPIPDPFVADLPLYRAEKLAVRVYPNPLTAQSRVQVSLPEPAALQVMLKDQTGRLIKELVNIAHYDDVFWETDLLDVDLPAGIYFLQARSGKEQVVKKLIRIR